MQSRVAHAVRALTLASVRRPRSTLAIFLLLVTAFLSQARHLESEVGYPSYFGPGDPRVQRLTAFLEEFGSGLHVVVAFGCQEGRSCRTVSEPRVLDLSSRTCDGPGVSSTRRS
jgi:predicted RND superfamily exporter protein